ncbi:MFS transporter [Staphylococcus simulans]|uniref:MFS transporter n=1 Tax=Staphylococcus simulans TaxID=1286 RepID=UPI00399C36B1
MNWLMHKLGLKNARQLAGYLSVVTAGQIIYSGFEAFKGTFYNQLLEILHVNNAELGVIFSLIGLSMFFYIPGGWINNRFSIRSLLITGMLIRFITMCVVIFMNPSFAVLKIITVIWGLVEAFFWPAVLNGVVFFTDREHRGLGFGLLESIRRAQEMLMNLLLVAIMAAVSGLVVLKGGMIAYNLLLIPMMLLIWKFVPKNGIAADETHNEETGYKSAKALKGLLFVLTQPKIWLAAITAMSVYWGYIILIYTVPYLQSVYHLSTAQTAFFGVINTAMMGVFAGIIAGVVSDFIFKSSAKMIGVALLSSAIILIVIVYFNIGTQLSIILLVVLSLTTFLSKSVLLAPISELKLPKDFSGSAMSVGSFLAYAPIFWVYQLNGNLLDTFKGHEVLAYQMIFKIGIVVALCGAISALVLTFLMKRTRQQELKNEMK